MNGAGLLRCICDDTRFSILEMLQQDGELCVGDFVRGLERDQPLVSHHLKALRECGILRSRADGKKVMYSVANRQLSEMISGIIRTSRQIQGLCSCDADGRCNSSSGSSGDGDGRMRAAAGHSS